MIPQSQTSRRLFLRQLGLFSSFFFFSFHQVGDDFSGCHRLQESPHTFVVAVTAWIMGVIFALLSGGLGSGLPPLCYTHTQAAGTLPDTQRPDDSIAVASASSVDQSDCSLLQNYVGTSTSCRLDTTFLSQNIGVYSRFCLPHNNLQKS